MKEKNSALLVFGIINATSVFIVYSLCSMLALPYVMLEGLNDAVRDVLDSISMIIFCLFPLSCILGIVLGILFRKKDYAKTCIILSVVGILLFVVGMSCMLYIALRF